MHVVLKMSDAGMYAGVVKTKLPHAYFEGEAVVIQSQLDADASLGQHLDWLLSIVIYERPLLRAAVANGASLVVEASFAGDPIRISSHDVHSLFLLNVDLVVNVSRSCHVFFRVARLARILVCLSLPVQRVNLSLSQVNTIASHE